MPPKRRVSAGGGSKAPLPARPRGAARPKGAAASPSRPPPSPSLRARGPRTAGAPGQSRPPPSPDLQPPQPPAEAIARLDLEPEPEPEPAGRPPAMQAMELPHDALSPPPHPLLAAGALPHEGVSPPPHEGSDTPKPGCVAVERILAIDVSRARPRWVTDEEAAGCMVCTAEFSFFVRRHHCRYCGSVVCGDCFALRTLRADRWLSEEPGHPLETLRDPARFELPEIRVCFSCSREAPAEIAARVDAARRGAAARQRAQSDAGRLDDAALAALTASEAQLRNKAVAAGIDRSRLGSAASPLPKRELVALVMEGSLSQSLTEEEVRNVLIEGC